MIALAAGGSAHTSSPSIRTRPLSGRSRPVIIDSEVVFPAPFGPTSPASEPAAMSRSTPATASLAPKLFRSACTLMPDLPICAFPSAIRPMAGPLAFRSTIRPRPGPLAFRSAIRASSGRTARLPPPRRAIAQ